MTADPWTAITPPAKSSVISARRVGPSARWDLYWGVDVDRKPLLILQHGKGLRKTRRLPKLRGLQVETLPAEHGTDERILIRLTDAEQRDIFLRFCRDIVDATVLARTAEQAVERFLARTWRWHRLLQGGRDSRLGDDEQKGLLGELVVLERYFLPVLGATDAVRSWTGPLDSPHDFEISNVHVEAKARGSSVPHVNISSELQLDSSSADTLFLHVTEIVTAAEGTANASTLPEVATAIRSEIANQDMAAVELFEKRLSAVGFDWADDYSDKLWLVVGEALYEVRDGFPRIIPAVYPGGVDNVRYAVSLPDCEAFRALPSDLRSIVGEMVNVP